MSDGIIRLLNSLNPLGRGPDGWLTRSARGADPGTTGLPPPDDEALADRVQDLRRAFPLADIITLQTLAAVCSFLSLPGGCPLILQGEQPEAVYIVVTGGFAAYRSSLSGEDILLDRFGAGDVIGDNAFITGEAWAVSIKAMRNSELLRVARQDLVAAAARCPGTLLAVCSGVIQRLQRAQCTAASPQKCSTFCFFPVEASIDIRSIMQQTARCLAGFGTVTIVSAEQTSGRPSAWFSQVERACDFVLLEAEPGATAWTRFCLRQCDHIVLLAQGDAAPANCMDPKGMGVPRDTPLSLMLLWADTIRPTMTTAWLKSVKPSTHHHIRSTQDTERATRLIAGRGVGLVLSGGGAKALAHIGVIDALRQNDIHIDVVGGTSVGGIVAAVHALEWDLAATVQSLAAAFGRRRFSDFAVPRTALYSERAFARTLGHCFGEIALEDAPIPLFCVSTNLTEGTSAVHRVGPLVTWLRATSAVPGICPPIIERNTVYVDGGVLDNMPTGAMRDFGVASVISVDVGSSLEAQARFDGEFCLPSMVELLWRVGTIGSDSVADRVCRAGEVVLRPEVGKMGLFEWSAHGRAIAAGYQAVLDHLNEINAALSHARNR